MGDIIMFDDPRAAHPCLQQGWHSRDGYFYADERTARYAGCTHRPCEECGTATPKSYTLCPECREKRAVARYEARPQAEWDGKQMLYSEVLDEYYSCLEDAEDSLLEDQDIGELRLMLCEPQIVRELDADYFADELPEDDEAPDVLLAAIDAFNATTKGLVLSWWPGKTRMSVEPADQPDEEDPE